jgi:plasmid stabilization system protein ParE
VVKASRKKNSGPASRANRDKAPRLLEDELRETFRQLRSTPSLGALVAGENGVRRVGLTHSRYVLFYAVDGQHDEVLVLQLWHASRGVRPALR